MNKYELALVVNAKIEDDVRTATVERAKEYITRAAVSYTHLHWHRALEESDAFLQAVVTEKQRTAGLELPLLIPTMLQMESS